MKKLFYPLAYALTAFLILYSCSAEEEDTTPPPTVQQPTPEPEPEVSQFTLTVTAGEGGTVSTEGGTYDEGTEVTITATPAEGYEFVGWEGSDSTEVSLTVTLGANTTLNALFEESTKVTLTVKSVEDGTVIANAGEYSVGDLVTIQAVPNEGYGFLGWGGFIPPNTTSPLGSGEEFPNEKEELSFYIYEDLTVEPNYYWHYPIENITLPSSSNSLLNDTPINYFKNLTEISIVSRDYAGFPAVLDYNNDGNLDLIHTNSNYNASFEGILDIRKMKFFLGDENGYLREDENLSNIYDGLIHNYRTLLGDFDNNGYMDVFFSATGFDDGSVSGEKPLMLLNNGNSTFEIERFEDYDVHGYWHGATSSDFDNDGRIEIILLNPLQERDLDSGNRYTSKIIEIVKNKIEISPLEIDFLETMGKLTIESFDLNNDGHLDLIICGNDVPEDVDGYLRTETGFVDENNNPIFLTLDDFKSSFVWYGSSQGFKEKITLPINEYFYKVMDVGVVDIDSDGDKDLVLSRNAGYQEAYYQIIRNNIDSFEDVTEIYIDNNDLNIEGGSSSEIIVGDFNKDGIIELHHNEADKFRNQFSFELIDNKFQLVKRITN